MSKDEPSKTDVLLNWYLGPLNPVAGIETLKEDQKALDKLASAENTVSSVFQKLWGFVKQIGKGIWQFFSFLIDVVTGDAIATWGLAPYLALPGILLFPINAMVPGVEELLVAPFGFIGIGSTVITFYQFISGLYYLMITIYNLYEGDKLK